MNRSTKHIVVAGIVALLVSVLGTILNDLWTSYSNQKLKIDELETYKVKSQQYQQASDSIRTVMFEREQQWKVERDKLINKYIEIASRHKSLSQKERDILTAPDSLFVGKVEIDSILNSLKTFQYEK